MSADPIAPPALLGLGRRAEALEVPADAEAFHREGIARGWTDGLPLLPPTEERVAAMLGYCDLDPLDVLAVIAPGRGEATVQAVAVNAVMAGCEPRYFPIVVAAIRGLAIPALNIDSVNATTHPSAIFVLVSGPVGREVGIHSGSGCFGPTFSANATIGRAVRLVLLNIGRAIPGVGDFATQGTPAKFAMCIAENEDASPWPPFHTTRGLTAEQSGVTIAACEGPHNIQDHGSNTAEGVLQTIAGAMGQAGSNNIWNQGESFLVLCPEHAATIAAEGWSREAVQEYLWTNARFPAGKLSAEFRELVETFDPEVPRVIHEDSEIAIAAAPRYIHIIVAGGPGKQSSWLPTFGAHMEPVTVLLTTSDGTPLRSVEKLRR
jgi:hypothetical protein